MIVFIFDTSENLKLFKLFLSHFIGHIISMSFTGLPEVFLPMLPDMKLSLNHHFSKILFTVLKYHSILISSILDKAIFSNIYFFIILFLSAIFAYYQLKFSKKSLNCTNHIHLTLGVYFFVWI
jgi:hypothetical protein